MSRRNETSAGGVVYRRVGDLLEIAAGGQRDRLSGSDSLRLPKGIVEPGESPEQAAVREVDEEMGLEAEIVAPLTTVAYEYDEGGTLVSKQVHFFLMKHIGGQPHPRDGEMASASWFPADHLADQLTFDTERVVVTEALDHLSGRASAGER
jgi:8-oxo-dGTP pyrophosphatase MutT (NUDIX family)